MKSYNLSSLPYATRDKKGNIIATDGTIILNAVIRSINSHKITHKKSALAIRAFDSNNSLLKMDGMGWIVHRFVDSAGLKVDHHKTRGRSLAPGQCSSYTYKQCAPNERSFVGQFSDNASLIAASPTPVSKPVNDIAEQRFCENGLKPHDVEKVAKRLNDMRRKAREEHADRLAEFLGNQRYIFLSPIDQNRITMNFQALAGTIDAIFVNARELRAGRIDEERFFVVRNRNVEAMRSYMQRGGLTAENLVNLILQMPGFQINNNLLEDAMRSRIVLNMNRNLSLYELRSSYDLPAGVIDLIRQLARLFVFRIAGKCDVITQPRAFEPIDLM